MTTDDADAYMGVLLWDTTHVILGHLAALGFPEVCQLMLLNFLLLALHTLSKVLVCLQLLGSAPVWRSILLAHLALFFLLQPNRQLGTARFGAGGLQQEGQY